MMRNSYWFFDGADLPESDQSKLNDYDKINSLTLEKISRGPRNRMSLCRLSKNYYVKQYNNRKGGLLRSWWGKSRIENEFNNLNRFHAQGIPAPHIVAFGYKKEWGKIQEGVLVTLGIDNTVTLSDLAENNQLQTRGKSWLMHALKQIADYTARMHADNFMFSDLKWRNILVSNDAAGTVYFIDCPNGMHVPKWFMWRAIIKDLACLDKIGKTALTQTQRLAFYKQYRGITKLTSNDKKRITNILKFFEGRE